VGTDRHPERYVRRRVGRRPLQRAAAIGALLAEVVAVGLLVVIVLQRPLFAVVLLVLVVVVLAASFVALTSLGLRRLIAASVGAGLALLFVVGLIFLAPGDDEPRWMAPAVVACVIVAALLQRYTLQVPPPASPKLFQVRPGQRRATERGVLIVNPRSGGGKAESAGVVARAEALGVRTVVLEEGDDLLAVARRAADGADALGMAGGDGSLGCVAGVAIEHDLPFVCVPAGTRNHFALDLGLDRDDPCQALSAFVTGEERRLDHATVNDRVFLNNVALGVYAAVVEQPAYRDAKVETTLSLLPKLVSEGGPWFDLRFDVPDHGHLESTSLLMVSNNAYDLRAAFGRRGALDGGELGILTVDPQHLGDVVQMTVLAATRRPELASALWAWSAPEFEVASGEATLSAGVDGETVQLDTPLRFACVAGGLRVLVPRGTRVGLREQRRGNGGHYSGLFEVAFNPAGPGD
jgi:diacylglycerol kinase family enzyme